MSYITLKRDADGIVDMIVDQPNKKVNIMGLEYDAAMKKTIAELTSQKDDITGIYLTSGKPNHFFAGGDVKAMLAMDLDPPQKERDKMFVDLMASKKCLRDLETLGVPVAVGINGAALGGGYELCLASHYRVAVDTAAVRIGLPESQLGLLPGAGGIVRLTRLLGVAKALPLISQGRQLRAAQALKHGLVDALVADEKELASHAKAWIKEQAAINTKEGKKTQQIWDQDGYQMPGGVPGDRKAQELQGLLYFGPVQVMNQTFGLMPAQKAIFAAVCESAMVDFDTAQKIEARYFMHLLLDQTARNMMTTFFVQMQAVNGGASRPADIAKREVKRVGVLGAGQMGSGIAFIAAKAGINVVLKDQDLAMAEKGKAYSKQLVDRYITKKRLDEQGGADLLARIEVTDNINALKDCDTIIEAVFEDTDLKASVTKETEAVLSNTAVFASNTSALPITNLAKASQRPENFIGMHFFSPAEVMPLVEIICGKQTSKETLAYVFDLARTLGKTPIVVNDGPGFFTSRVIGKMMSQGLRMLAEGVDPVMLENAMRQAGYRMPPLELVDMISQQTSYRIANEHNKAIEASGKKVTLSAENILINDMVNKYKRLGKIHGAGFYEYPKEGKPFIWPKLRELFSDGPSRGLPIKDIQDRVMYAKMLEAVRAHAEGIIDSVADANIGSIMGIGFPAHTGGVLQGINAIGLKKFVQRCDDLHDRFGDDFAAPALLRDKAKRGEVFS